MGKYFGTDGIRGKANQTLTVETVYKVGRFIGDYYSKNKKAKIVIGKDTRLSSSMFESTLASGISASGGDAYLIGYCSTPCLAYLASHEDFDCGIMISASHNPFSDNGVKLFSKTGLKIQEDLEKQIEDYIDCPEGIEYRTMENIGSIYSYTQGIEAYQNWLAELFPLDLSALRIVLDLANGSNCYTARKVLEKMGANLTILNDQPNGLNINTNCGSTHLGMLQEEMKKGNYDVGFAFDGDADRVLLVGPKGEVVDGDKIMFLLAKHLKAQGLLKDNKLVTTVMSNIGLFKSLDQNGISYEVTSVGDKYVVDCMVKNAYSLGGEQSGHIINANHCIFGDGLKTALDILSAMTSQNKTLNELIDEVNIYPQLLVNERVNDKNIVLNDEEINQKIEEIATHLGNDGRILVRPSGTEPLIRVMVEAKDEETCHACVYEVIDLIVEKGYAKNA